MDEDMFDTAQYIGSQKYPLSQASPASLALKRLRTFAMLPTV